MPENRDILTSPIHIRIDKETEALVAAIADLRNEKKADVMRRFIREGARAEILSETSARDQLLYLIRKAVAETNKPFEERLAKIAAKGTINSGIAMYTNLEVLGQLGRSDIRDIHTKARKRAVANLKSTDDLTEEKVDKDDINE